MTSANFRTYPIREITIDRTTRQRQALTGIEELAESIARLGLINPIVIDESGTLIAGERRLTACTSLGWDHITVQFAEDLDEYTRQCIEFEENVKRSDLTWQEEVEALARLHRLKQENEPDWSLTDTADLIGFSPNYVEKRLQVAKSIDSAVVSGAEKFSTALNIVRRDSERRKTSALASVAATPITTYDTLEDEPAPVAVPLLNTSFHDWQESYDGPKFNLIHCDFPYGINVADAPRMSAAIRDHYDDSPDVYWSLLARLSLAMENVVADSAHLIFWHAFKFHGDTRMELERMGWTVQPYPLIWHKSDGSGIAPDPQRAPRNTYEAAFFCTRGDRKLTAVGTKSNSFAFPGRRDGAIHVSEKPYTMLKHFMAMICDDYSHVLDPTAGSANALKVAEDLGATRVLGLEQSEDFYTIACENWSLRE